MKKGTMTMMELQYELGSSIKEVRAAKTPEDREIAIEVGRVVTAIGTQMINNGRFILDAEKLEAQIGSLKHSKATDLIGD